MHLSTSPRHPPRSPDSSFMKLPRINHFLSQDCHPSEWNDLCNATGTVAANAAEEDVKIYLLMLLIGILLAAIHFTSTPERRPETLPQ
jgi:hypothetical protein